MTDQELADRIVALGVGRANQIYPDALGRFYQIDPDADWQTSVNETKFVRDWRVAGAMMEKCDSVYPDKLTDGRWQAMASINAMPSKWIMDESLPRAINEACCEALGE